MHRCNHTRVSHGGCKHTEDEYKGESSLKQDFGFDIKYNITSDLTLDLTANTDFAQVEADEQQLNLTRFSIDFPEKRQFFQQRSGLFDFSFGRTQYILVDVQASRSSHPRCARLFLHALFALRLERQDKR